MDKLMLFLFSPDGFLSYLVTYLVYIIAIVAAFFIGFGLRKAKNKKVEGLQESDSPETAAKA